MSAEDETRRIEISMELTPSGARELLEKLATDDAFRGTFESDPVTVLGDHNITVSPDLVQGMPLPSKADLQRVLDQIAANEYDPASPDAPWLGSVLPLICYPLIRRGPAAS